VRAPLRRRDRAEIVALTGQRRVPVLLIEGDVICDSKRIVENLEHRADEREHDAPDQRGLSSESGGLRSRSATSPPSTPT
jgi:glutathione S-transferase